MSDITDVDHTGLYARNSIFGDRISGQRDPDILVQFQYNISTYDVATSISGTGAVSHANATMTLTSGASTGTADAISVRALRYQPGFDGYAYFTAAFSKGDTGSYQRAGLFDGTNGYWLGQVDGEFLVGRRASSTDYTAAANFPDDHDPTMMNIYRIGYGWLGVAPITFEVFCAGRWYVVGQLTVANTQTTPSTYQPTQPLCMQVGRTSGSGAVTIDTASWSAGRVCGNVDSAASFRQFALNNSKDTITTETNIITLQNAATFQSLTNHVVVRPVILSVSGVGNKGSTVRLVRNTTLGGSPSYTNVDADNSVVSYDTAGTTLTGGDELLSLALAKEDSIVLKDDLYVDLNPGETLTVASSSSQATETSVSLTWQELF